MVISWNRETPKSPKFLDGIFHCKPSIFGVSPWLWNSPHLPENTPKVGQNACPLGLGTEVVGWDQFAAHPFPALTDLVIGKHMGVSINGGSQECMVYKGQSCEHGWFSEPPTFLDGKMSCGNIVWGDTFGRGRWAWIVHSLSTFFGRWILRLSMPAESSAPWISWERIYDTNFIS